MPCRFLSVYIPTSFSRVVQLESSVVSCQGSILELGSASGARSWSPGRVILIPSRYHLAYFESSVQISLGEICVLHQVQDAAAVKVSHVNPILRINTTVWLVLPSRKLPDTSKLEILRNQAYGLSINLFDGGKQEQGHYSADRCLRHIV